MEHLAPTSHHLTAKARDRCATTSLGSIVVLDGLSSTPPRAHRRPPRTDAPLTHFRSPPGEKCGLDTQFDRRDFLGAGFAAAALAACGSPSETDEPSQWNIVWIMADDLSPDLSCYGSTEVSTPNIDRLAAEGARFTNAYITCPVCSPSRSALITGMYQTSIGAHRHRSHRNDGYTLPSPVRMITEYFREAGYYTVNDHESGLGGRNKIDYNFSHENPFEGNNWRDRAEGQSFYAQVNIFEPHRGRPPDIWSFTDRLETKTDPEKVTPPAYYPNDEISRKDWAGYLDAVRLLDEKVGNTLNRIDEDGLADNTIVIFFGDHGRPMPRDKQFLYDGGIKIPLIIRWPAMLEPGSVRDELINSIDISATSLSLAGIAVPEYMEGRVFLGPEKMPDREYIFAARDRCDETVDRIRAVRDKRFKYIRNFHPDRPYMQLNRYKEVSYPIWRQMLRLEKAGTISATDYPFLAKTRPEEELYDTDADPNELHNLADSPEHQETLTKMASVLALWIQQTGDHGEQPEDPAAAVHWDAQMIEAYKDVYPLLEEREEPWK